MAEIVDFTGIELAQAIRSKTVSCRDVMAAYLDRISRINPDFNALVALRDRDDLLREADERDRQLARGEVLGWLHGFPQAPKDITAVAGMVTTLGSPLLRNNVPAADSIISSRMRAAGAIFIGRTNVPEFGLGSHTYNTVYGTTLNAYDRTKTAGGSSGGAAVALAQQLLPVADGSDMMGSLRNPAGFNNVVGFRPSLGRVPYGPADEVFFGMMPTEGPMGRTVADTAMLMSVLAGPDRRAPLSVVEDARVFAGALDQTCKGLRVGWLGDFNGYLATEPGVLDVCQGALTHFTTLGCIVEPAAPAFDMAQLWEAWLVLRAYFIAGRVLPFYSDPVKREQLKPEAAWEAERGLALPAAALWQASLVRTAWYHALNRLFEQFDFLVLPTAQVFPFDAKLTWPKAIAGRSMDTYHRWMEVVMPATMAGVPAIGVPAGFSATGLPMGLQIIGPIQADLAVLKIAHAYEQVANWTRHRPA